MFCIFIDFLINRIEFETPLVPIQTAAVAFIYMLVMGLSSKYLNLDLYMDWQVQGSALIVPCLSFYLLVVLFWHILKLLAVIK